MKTIFRKLTCGLLLLSGAVLGGCSSDPDGLDSELHLDRALMPLNFKAVVQTTGNEVKMTWDVRSTVAEYEVVIYSDEAQTQQVETYKVAPADVPVTLTLDAEKTYYASVQAFAKDKKATASKKATAGPIKTYAIMSGLKPEITDRASTSLSLKWDVDEYVSHIQIQPVPEGDPKTFQLSAAQIETGAAVVTGLTPSTEYTLSVFYNSASRGNDTAWTRPDTQGATEVTTAEALLQAVTDGAPKILVKYSEVPYDVSIPADVVGATNALSTVSGALDIIGETTKDGKKPVMKGLEVKLQVATARAAGYSLHLEDLTLDGNGAGNAVSVSAALTMDAISIKNCEVYNYAKGVLAENIAATVGNVMLEGLYVHDIEGNGGDVLDMRLGTYTNFTLKNSTFCNGGRSFLFLDAKTTVSGQVIIRNNTISNFALQTNRKGLICVRSLALTPDKFFVDKNVILNQNVATGYTFISDYKECTIPQFASNYFFNYKEDVFFTTSNTTPKLTPELCMVNGSKKLSADPCENSMKGKLYLTNAEIVTVGVGDPRWWTAVPPVVPEQTELVALKDKKEWNFANTDSFEAQSVTRTRILDNVQFIVSNDATPMTITDKGLVSFFQASTVSVTGVPTNNALAFKVDGPGSVIITPADAGYMKHMEIIINGVRKAIPANGQESVYGFGDLKGENMVYICSCSPVNLVKLGWTTEVVSGGDAQQLTTPEPAVTPASVDAGSEMAADVAWTAVPGAESYDVTFNGKTTNVTTVSYAIPAATVKALTAGTYEISVVAKPQEGSKSYTPSEAGKTTLTVKAVLTTLTAAKTWDIADATKFPAGNITETTVMDNLQFIVSDPAKGMTIEHATDGTTGEKTDRIKFNGKSTMSGVVPTNRGISFKVSGNGILTYRAVSSSSTGTGRHFQVSANGTQVISYETPLTAAEATDQTYEFTNLSGETTIYIYCDNTINVYGLGWTPSGGSVTPGVNYSWNFSDAGFADLMTALVGNPADLDQTVSGLRVNCGGGSIKSGVNSGSSYIQMGGVGTNAKRVCSFKAPASGKLTVVASNTGSTEDLTRMVTVEVEGETPVSKPGGSVSSTLTTVEFDLAVTGEKTVYIYCTGNALRFYSIAFSSPSN